MNDIPQIPQEDNIDLKRYFQIVAQHKWLGLVIAAMVTILFVLYAYTLPDSYEGEFSVYYNSVNETGLSADNAVIYTQPDVAYWEKTMVSSKIFELVKEYSGLSYTPQQLKNIYTITSGKEQNLFEIKLKTDTPEIIPELATAYVHAINTIDSHNQSAHFVNKIRYLNTESENNRRAIDSCDLQIMQLSSRLNLQNIESVDQLTSIRENFKKELKSTEVELSYVRASKEKTESELSNLNDTIFEKSSFTEPLKVQLMNLHVDLARAKTKYGESHPAVLGIRGNITHVEEMLLDGFEQNIVIKDISSNPIKRTLLGQLIQIKIDEISLEAKLNSLQNIINNTNTTDAPNQELYQLLRNRETQLANSDFLNKKIIDLEMSMKGVSSSFYLIDQPAVPENSSKRGMKMYLIMGIMAGLMAAVGLIVIYDLIDDRIKLVDDFSRFFSITILGAIKHRSGKDLLLSFKKHAPEKIYEDFENELTDIRINLKQLIGEDKNRSFSLISPLRKDGKSLILYLLAMEYANIGKRVLIMDFDVFAPKMSEQFGVEKDAGIQDFLLSDAKFDGLVQSTRIPGVDIMPLGKNPYNVKLLFDTEKVDELLDTAVKKYDMVIVDTPALLLSPEVIGLIKRIDKNILITRIGHTSRKNIDLVLDKLKNIPSAIVGTILTDIKPVPLGSYYDKYTKYRKYYNYDKQGSTQTEKKKWGKGKVILTSILSLVVLTGIVLGLLSFLPGIVSGQEEIEKDNISTAVNQETLIEATKPSIDSISTIVTVQKETPRPYYIIAGCFSSEENAEKLVSSLKSSGYPACENIGKMNGLYTVSIGSDISKESATVRMEGAKADFTRGLWLYRFPAK